MIRMMETSKKVDPAESMMLRVIKVLVFYLLVIIVLAVGTILHPAQAAEQKACATMEALAKSLYDEHQALSEGTTDHIALNITNDATLRASERLTLLGALTFLNDYYKRTGGQYPNRVRFIGATYEFCVLAETKQKAT